MKTRAGFVSNSSSSSFCILGFRVKDDEIDDFEDLYNEYDDDSQSYIVGHSIASISDYEYEEIDFSNIIKHYSILKSKYPDKEINLFVGSVYS